MWTSLRPDNPAAKALIFKAALSSDGPLFEHPGGELRISNVLIAPAEKIDPQTQEVVQLIRVAVITEDGAVFDGFGMGLRKSIELLIAIYGDPPWSPPISLQVRKIKTNQGHTMALEPFVPKPAKPERRN